MAVFTTGDCSEWHSHSAVFPSGMKSSHESARVKCPHLQVVEAMERGERGREEEREGERERLTVPGLQTQIS